MVHVCYLRACLHGGGGWGNPPVHIISHLNVITFTVRWSYPPHVTSPTWGPPLPCKQALRLYLGIKTVKRCGVGGFHVLDMFVKLCACVAK